MKRILNKLEKKKLKEKIHQFLKNEIPGIITAYIFGSFNSDDPFSDIDIAILLAENYENTLIYELDLEAALYELIRIPVDIRILNHAPISFSQEVIRHGKVLLDQNIDYRADFENLTLKKYFDFSYFRCRYLEDVYNAPL